MNGEATPVAGEIPSFVSLDLGQTVLLALPSLAGAGYLWQAAVEGDTGIVEIEIHRGGEPPAARRRVGAALPETVRLTGVAAGRGVLRLTQRRPWERDVPPRARHAVEIVVE